MLNNYEKISVSELEKKLEQLKDLLEEVKEEKESVLKQTGIHLPGSTLPKYEAEIKDLKQKIALVETLLKSKASS